MGYQATKDMAYWRSHEREYDAKMSKEEEREYWEKLINEGDVALTDFAEEFRKCDYCGDEEILEVWEANGHLCESCYEEEHIDWYGVRC